MVPSRILLFYIHHFVDNNGDQSNEIRPLVQTCDYQVGSNRARRLRMEETHLCSCLQLSMKRESSQDEVRVNIPKLYLVSANDLKSPVLAFEEHPGLCESWQGKLYVWSVRDRQTKWSHMFPLLDD
jgi:isopentenyl diphosphate isomerase/L-lactate dehydrogenase-like FMN-dependent dehydrogenase